MVRNLTKTCEVCHKSMRGDVLKRHMKKHAKEPVVGVDKNTAKCEICMKIMRKDNLKRHMKKHEKNNVKDNMEKVQIIMQDFNRKMEMGRRIKEIQTDKNFIENGLSKECKEALDIFNRYGESSRIQKSNFECGICNKSFNRKDNLKMHMKTHEEKTILNGGGGEKQKEDNEAGLLNKNNSVGETSLGDESDSDVLEPIYEDVWMYNDMVFKRIYKRIGHKDILTCLRDYNKKYFKDLIENYQKKMRRCKLDIIVKCNLKVRNHDGLLIPTTWLCKVNEDFRHITHYDDLMEGVINSVNRRFEEYDFYGKGKILTNIENITIKLACI